MPDPIKANRISIKKRLQTSIKAHSTPVEVFFRKGLGKGISGPIPSFEDTRAWAERVQQILTIGRGDKATKKAFDTFGLDPVDPRNWASLLRALAEVLEPELDDLAAGSQTAGAKKDWTRDRRLELVRTIERVRQSSAMRLSDKQICKRLVEAKESPALYRDSTVGALVRQAVAGRRQWRRLAERDSLELPAFLRKRKNK